MMFFCRAGYNIYDLPVTFLCAFLDVDVELMKMEDCNCPA